jgi:hypothetical protein
MAKRKRTNNDLQNTTQDILEFVLAAQHNLIHGMWSMERFRISCIAVEVT